MMKVFRGERFLQKFDWVGALPRRDIFAQLDEYLGSDEFRNRVRVLYGLRRTGKSVMMLQAMLGRMEDSAYIFCEEGDSLNDLSETMDDLWDDGVRNLFIDEISVIPDFIAGSQFIADIYTGKGKVVVTGTDSLSFEIARHSSLSFRTAFIHTTRIPFREHSRLLGTESLDEYARCGGILTTVSDFADHPLEAIASNIQNSLRNYRGGERFLNLRELYDEGKLLTVIRNVVRDENHKFSRDVLRKMRDCSDYVLAKSGIIDDDIGKRASKAVRLKPLIGEVMRRLGVSDVGRLDRGVSASINLYLQKLGLIEPGLVIGWEDLLDGTDVDAVAEKLSWKARSGDWRGKWIFRQPGLRWGQVDALLKSVLERMLEARTYDREVLDALFASVRSNAMGMVMEDIIISETAFSLNYEVPVFKYIPGDGDIDMVVLGHDAMQVYEIKHSSTPRTGRGGFGRHVFDRNVTDDLERWFGRRIDFRGILHSGKTGERYGFVNAAEYLSNLEFPAVPMLGDPNPETEGMRS